METYNGHVRTPADAIVLFEACRLGLLPRVQRRLSEKERQSIKSGSVFVWDEREAGMRRWTDGKSWSASRVSGSFLTYREMEGKRGGNGFAPPLAATRAGKTPDSTRGSDSDLEMAGGEDGPDGYRYKADGLMKQSFSITTSSGNHLHLISYYSRSHPNAQGLNNPTADPNLRHIRPQKGMYPESTVHEQQNIPAVTRAPMVSAPYSTVPQMPGYSRTGPIYAQAGYAWTSQPPIPTPQHSYAYQYSPNGAPPPGSNGHSPLSYSQSAHPPTSQPQTSSVYDRSPVPEHTTPPHHRSSNSGNGMSDYRKSSPHVSQPSMKQQQQQQQPQQYPPPHPSQHHSQSQPQPRNPSSPPPMSKIDPRLMAPSPLTQDQSHIISLSRSPTPSQPLKQEGAEHNSNSNNNNATPTRMANGTSQASTIPSIGSLMNGASADNTDAKSDISTRSGSRSPGGTTKKKDGPKDIPSDKLGFGEDMRALRVLDRAFKT
ncbi:hypothetical protein MMC07_005424 [Pseudocyphellaria aurata]|nr:hypothetical protein [Pseudocyphellaria aurata]